MQLQSEVGSQRRRSLSLSLCSLVLFADQDEPRGASTFAGSLASSKADPPSLQKTYPAVMLLRRFHACSCHGRDVTGRP